jgi:hypothetical protein
VLIILALFSTVSKTTLIIFVFGTQILREVRYENEPKLFRVLVLSYWFAGTLGVALTILAAVGVLH